MEAGEIRQELFLLQDKDYRDFQSKLIPGKSPEDMIGVRTPALRSFAKKLLKEGREEVFLEMLPHLYFDEDQLHAFVLSEIKDYDREILLLKKCAGLETVGSFGQFVVLLEDGVKDSTVGLTVINDEHKFLGIGTGHMIPPCAADMKQIKL